MYDFNNGRFLSVDPFIQGTTSQAINPYSYIHNNPLSGTDPTGYACEDADDDGGGDCNDEPKRKNKKRASAGVWGVLQVYNGGDSNGNDDNNDGDTSDTGSQNLLAQNDTTEQKLHHQMICEARPTSAGCGGNEYSVIQEDVSRLGEGATDVFGDPLTYIGGGVYKAAGSGLLYLVKGSKLIPFAKTFGLAKDAKFAQSTFRNEFSKDGIKEIANITGVKGIRSVDQLSDAIVAGKVNPSDIHIDVIARDGTTLILNTRSAHALEQAGILRSSFSVIDRTGDIGFETRLTEQLTKNKLNSTGTSTVVKEY